MPPSIKKLIAAKDYLGLQKALSSHPHLANESIPIGGLFSPRAHPLHRICDGVFAGKYTDEEAIEMARIFLEFGSYVDGNEPTEKRDTPLIAATSLHADRVAILYIENGANIHHAGTHGGTALHWAAWCGRDQMVKRLILEGAEINKRCVDFEATPLFWTVHGFKNNEKTNLPDYLECIKALLQAGADKTIPNKAGKTVFDLLTVEDAEIRTALD